MGEFLAYSIMSGFLMLALYLAYRLFLAENNQHSFNRGILMMIYFVSFAISPFVFSLGNISDNMEPHTSVLEGTAIADTGTAHRSIPLWGTILIWIYITGMIVVALRTADTWLRLISVIRSGKKIREAGYTLVVTDNEKYAPFSWLHYVVISRRDYDNSPAIAAHELKHIACHHWIDLLIAQMVCIVNWFNPAAWLMRDELMLVHEYQADMAVIGSGYDAQSYQMLLIKKAVGARFPSLANSLNHSKLKKRITMMYKVKSGAGSKFKALALVPMLALALGVAGIPAVHSTVSTIRNSNVSVGKSSEISPQSQVTAQIFKVTNINTDGKLTTVVIRGENLGNNLTTSGGTFTNGNSTYHANSLECKKTNGIATITARFPFSEKLKDPKMTLIVNGEEIPFDLKDFTNGYQYAVSVNSSSLPDDIEIYLDGKKITASEMEKISPDNIKSITVDKNKKSIYIETI